MGRSDVIAGVTETLTALIKTLPNPVSSTTALAVVAAAPSANGPDVTVYLYDVLEDPMTRNRPAYRETTPDDVIRTPPMALLLRYLIVVRNANATTEQRILGAILQLFYDRPVLSDGQLAGALTGSVEELRLELVQLSLDDRNKIWTALTQKAQLSVAYEVRVVRIDSARVPRPVRAVRQRSARYSTVEELT